MLRRRALAWAVVAVVAVAVVAVPLGLSAMWQRKEGVDAACARIYENDKTELSGYRWGWMPPAWVCEYDASGGKRYERRLPFGQR